MEQNIPNLANLFLITGRILHDDDDVSDIVEAGSEGEAQRKFARFMLEDAGFDKEDITDEKIKRVIILESHTLASKIENRII